MNFLNTNKNLIIFSSNSINSCFSYNDGLIYIEDNSKIRSNSGVNILITISNNFFLNNTSKVQRTIINLKNLFSPFFKDNYFNTDDNPLFTSANLQINDIEVSLYDSKSDNNLTNITVIKDISSGVSLENILIIVYKNKQGKTINFVKDPDLYLYDGELRIDLKNFYDK